MTMTEIRADMPTADINDLPDSAFAYIEPGGTKDSEGKTTPRSLRHFPIQDKAHVQNALARMGGSPFGAKAKPAILAAAKKFGIEVSDDDSRAAQAPLELRKRRRGTIGGGLERRALLFDAGQVELRAKPSGHGTTSYEFNGYAVVYEQPFEMWDQWGDPYEENVETRACARSVGRPDLNTPFLIGHDDGGIALARTKSGTMRLSDDSHGLQVSVPDLDGRSPLVQSLASAVERGDMDEMSVGFICRQQQWSPDYMTRAIREMDIHRGDVSIVVAAANPATAGATLTVPSLEAASARKRTEELARGELKDSDTHPDFNVDVPSYTASGSVECPSDSCPVYSGGDGDRALNAKDAKYCDQCGSSLYNSDGLIVLDDSGVTEEVGDSVGDADMRSRRLRLLELA